MIPTHIVVHHSATADTVTFDQIREVHIKRGWDDIGYHFVIDPAGMVMRGRAEDVVGAHALGINQHSLGVCLIGNFEEHACSTVQMDALVKLLHELGNKHRIESANVIGHCDVTCDERGGHRSLCPGKFLYQELGNIRSQLKKTTSESAGEQ